ncbi:hypothetical protein [Vibrio diazotrophicus]|uniref:hypothetical protein n=1 Tax=Vibrio diazotrophicus TaxID=685 RepID=UPI003D2F771F
MKKNLVCVLSVLIISGCSARVVLKTEADTSEIQPFLEFNVNGVVSVNNVQSNNDNVILIDRGMALFTGSKRELTDTVVTVTKNELSKRKAKLSKEAQIGLDIMVDKLDCHESFTSMTCETTISVATKSGYQAIYTSYGNSMSTIYNAVNYSLANSVSAMFRDPKIIEYLTN